MTAEFVPAGTGSVIRLRGATMFVKAGVDETGPELTVVESTDPEGFAPAPHRHHQSIEAFYVLAGRYTFTADGQVTVATAGDFLLVPKGATHSYVVGPGEGRILIMYAPAGVEQFWRAMLERGAAGPVPREERERLAQAIATDFD